MTDVAVPASTETADMSEEEGRRLIELEREVEKAMRSAGRIAGSALDEIRRRRLYRASHTSFEAYVLDRHGLSRSTAYRMIAVANGSDNGLAPEVQAIATASAQAAERRHTTLDQPPGTIDPRPEVLEPTPMEPQPLPVAQPKRGLPGRKPEPDGERFRKRAARDALNRVLAVIDAVEHADLVEVAGEAECIRVVSFAAPFSSRLRQAQREEDTIDPRTCPHPANRLIGDVCGRCGAKKAKK